MDLLCINGTWVKNPDPDVWSPVHNPEWTSGTGRAASGLMVGSRQYFKWKLALQWSHLTVAECALIRSLVENSGDYFPVSFYHEGEYIDVTCYASAFTPTGIYSAGGEVYYKKATVNLVEQ